jgi:N-acetylmuramic acid 6-phosphate etherase
MTRTNSVYEEFGALSTEQRNPVSQDIDELPTVSILRIINSEDKRVPLAVEREIPNIAAAVDLVVMHLRKGGRLIYVGAGSSGRLGILDAAECPPTFGTDPSMITGIIAGGQKAVFQAQEGAEDDARQAVLDIAAHGVSSRDVVCGIAASRRTPYVVAAIGKARELGAKTIYVTTNPRSDFNLLVDVAICPEVGPEVIMGSTRMKSGTAQKLVLNMLTTAAMIKIGKVYGNMMVDLQPNSEKLVERSKRTVMIATGIDYERASAYLAQCNGHVKTAIVMILRGVSAAEARKRLEIAGGFVKGALHQ